MIDTDSEEGGQSTALPRPCFGPRSMRGVRNTKNEKHGTFSEGTHTQEAGKGRRVRINWHVSKQMTCSEVSANLCTLVGVGGRVWLLFFEGGELGRLLTGGNV